MRKDLTFNDGVILCKYIYQSAIEKVLNGVIEQEEIFIKTHELLNKLGHTCDNKRLDDLLHLLNMENTYAVI